MEAHTHHIKKKKIFLYNTVHIYTRFSCFITSVDLEKLYKAVPRSTYAEGNWCAAAYLPFTKWYN